MNRPLKPFPEKVNQLTFVRELEEKRNGERVAAYACPCGNESIRTYSGAIGARLRSSFSGCPTCTKKNQGKKYGLRFGSYR